MDMEEALMEENENLIDKLGFWRLKKLTINFSLFYFFVIHLLVFFFGQIVL